MAKKVIAVVKLQVPAGNATPSPPVGPALGQHGVSSGEFCKQFNARTKDGNGVITPVVITIYQDKSFTFITKTPPASVLLKQAAGLAKGSSDPLKQKVAKVTESQIRKIAEQKFNDLNAADIKGAINIIKGTARSMGIEVVPG